MLGAPFHSQRSDRCLLLPSFSFLCYRPRNRRPSSMASKIVAEYAKSARSSCKKCGVSISKDELRLGVVSRDTRGFDVTKWHHFQCFPSGLTTTAEKIGGFVSLKKLDQEALVKSFAGGTETEVTSIHIAEKSNNFYSGVDCQEQGNSKKLKISSFSKETEVQMVVSASDIKDKYKESNLLPKWKAFQTVIFLADDDGLRDSNKIAAFDFDGCLAKTSVRRVGPDAWSLLYPSIPDKLQKLYNDGYKLVIFTNESNIERWKKERQKAIDSKIGRLNSFIKLVKVPIQVFIACGMQQKDDMFRKPKPGMWRLMEQKFNSGIEVDMEHSFYVGDAAGRVNDHSDADIGFAKAKLLQDENTMK
ncbi:polynucleotide 3'-phosphatase ZDP isoform X2 [Nymphaea colorata]|uniref:polynucleotide 3'-phosphatase ZDP isoform X2 n=1 Tax=Nymphaea colorata TaxID=210225 RepID=UPI00129E77AC|nr:polynucleotide 3'-phosphatase ZDP isoform X2 [Nymphaea colorata]